MSQYTYTLNPNQIKEESHTYKQSELDKMTMFRLQEICRKERLVIPSAQRTDREGLIHLIMRFRGQKEYRHIQDFCEGGMERIQEFLDKCGVQFLNEPRVSIPGTITFYQDTEMNELDGYQVEAEEELLCGNLLLVDEELKVYTCFYLDEIEESVYLFKGKDVPVQTLEKHQFSILYFPDAKISEFLYDCYYGKRVSMPGYIESVRIPLLDIQEKGIQQVDLPLVIDFGSCNTTMGICLSDGSIKIASAGGSSIIPSIIGIKEKAGGGARRQGPAAGLVQDGAAVPPAVQQPHMGRDPAHQLAPAQQDIQVDGQLPVPQELQHLQQGLFRPAHAQRVNDKQDFPHGPPPAARTPDHPPVQPADAAGRPAAMRPA